jgi:hypothetical protein
VNPAQDQVEPLIEGRVKGHSLRLILSALCFVYF